MVRYADDFVILVSGSKEEAEAEKDVLAEFLKKELRMELSMEKTLITAVGEGFEFLGYRVVQTRARLTGRLVGNLFIPKSKLQRLRDSIKARTTRSNLDRSLGNLIYELNPKIRGWRNYYRYATRACHEFDKLDWWLGKRILRWLQKKHPKTSRWALYERFYRGDAHRRYRRWGNGAAQLRKFREGATEHFPDRGIRIPNGWNADPEERFLPGAPDFWTAMNATLSVR